MSPTSRRYALAPKASLSLLMLLQLLASPRASGQDASFSQGHWNRLWLNPALAGLEVCPRFYSGYRNQMPSVPGSFISYFASADMMAASTGTGFGLSLASDQPQVGVFSQNSLDLSLSQRVRLSDEASLSLGLQNSLRQRVLDFGNMLLPSMIDPNSGPMHHLGPEGSRSRTYWDMGAGVSAHGPRWLVGASAQNIREAYPFGERNPSTRMQRKLTLHAAGELRVWPGRFGAPSVYLAPSALWQRQGDHRRLSAGGLARYQVLRLGGFLNLFPASGARTATAVLGFHTDWFTFAYSYDWGVGQEAGQTRNAHELSFGMKFECFERKSKRTHVPCPAFMRQ